VRVGGVPVGRRLLEPLRDAELAGNAGSALSQYRTEYAACVLSLFSVVDARHCARDNQLQSINTSQI
jgi:hypothetical protein